MNFRTGERDEPEINLIPFIDILLVVLIFLMLTTTYSKFTELKVNLPVADAQAPKQNPREIVVPVGSDGRYSINRQVLEGAGDCRDHVAASACSMPPFWWQVTHLSWRIFVTSFEYEMFLYSAALARPGKAIVAPAFTSTRALAGALPATTSPAPAFISTVSR